MIEIVTPSEARPREAIPGKPLVRNYFGKVDGYARGPQCFHSTFEPNSVIRPHFHRVDQFQVFVSGSATMGKHRLDPVTVHYADAFTPYGPINNGPAGMSFFNCRSRADVGAHWMPGSKDEMDVKAGRAITACAKLGLADALEGVRLELLIDPEDDGLAVVELVAPAGARLPSEIVEGSGRFQLVLEGSMQLRGRELPADSCAFASPGEVLSARRTGEKGLHLLELQLPAA